MLNYTKGKPPSTEHYYHTVSLWLWQQLSPSHLSRWPQCPGPEPIRAGGGHRTYASRGGHQVQEQSFIKKSHVRGTFSGVLSSPSAGRIAWGQPFYQLLLSLLLLLPFGTQGQPHYQVLIIGAGASGSMAAIQAGRLGASVLLLDGGPWVGGMLTSAGVSAIDGNHQLPSGLWKEFRDSLYAEYGGPQAVSTGWVSHTLFEPQIGQRIIRNMINKTPGVRLQLHSQVEGLRYQKGVWIGQLVAADGSLSVFSANILIDATELGDVAAALGVGADIGMDERTASRESFAPARANNIIQDLTYVLTLQDYGPGSDKSIPRPAGYDPNDFVCACDTADPSTQGQPLIDCAKMMTYGLLPRQKYMINWPNCGNDYYLNLLEVLPHERPALLEEAKQHSLRFLYFLQHELGLKHLGLAEGEYPTTDGLPLIPYHRESRRIHGLVRLRLNHLSHPYEQPEPLYRTGIAVGDYPIDHHHKKRPDAPDIDFINIKVPAYNVPMGALLPAGFPHFIVAEKSISVSNIVNGATRLQPVVIGIGQAAGVMAALAAQAGRSPEEIPVRQVQNTLLEQGAYLMPFIDVPPDDPHWKAIQRIGATGILKGSGVPYKWANQMWFYPDRRVTEFELLDGLRPYYPNLRSRWDGSGQYLRPAYLQQLLQDLAPAAQLEEAWKKLYPGKQLKDEHVFTRREIAVLLEEILAVFDLDVGITGISSQ